MYVELKNINKNFGGFKASDNVSFGIEKGKLIGLLGPSGSGKTTILRMIAGLETPDSGDILIDGKRINDVQASKRGIGFVFQSYALFQYMTVFDNIAFGLKVQKKSKREIHEKVMELVKLIGLEGLENRYPSQLSGGQRQRVAFARALGEFGATLMIAGNIPGRTQTMPLAIFFQVQAMNYKGAMLWVATIVAISVVMILILNFWSDKQQDIVGKRVRGGK